MAWDAGADKFVMLAHGAGQDASEITRQLNMNGYSATRQIVLDILHRQGAQNIPAYVDVATNSNYWNARADALAISQHNSGKTAQQISTLMIQNGYCWATAAKVEANLNRLGAKKVPVGLILGASKAS